MDTRTPTAALAFVALVITGCGSQGDDAGSGDQAAGLDCPSVEVIVPYAPRGGSDQQVRRLQPGIEDELGVRLNISYREGGDGSVGWNALAQAEPDGCTIANVVAPNISVLTLTGQNVGFQGADFEYIAWTEYSPNIIGVSVDSEYEAFEDFVTAAEENPGEITLAGVGAVGEVLANQVMEATGLDLSYIPVTGGVGDIIPQVAGGHIDAALSGFSLLDGDQLRPIVLSGNEPHEDFPDVPTFEEAGYPGVTLVTSWGLILPPETPQEIVEEWNAAVQSALETEDVQAAYGETPLLVLEQNATEARAYFEEQDETVKKVLGE